MQDGAAVRDSGRLVIALLAVCASVRRCRLALKIGQHATQDGEFAACRLGTREQGAQPLFGLGVGLVEEAGALQGATEMLMEVAELFAGRQLIILTARDRRLLRLVECQAPCTAALVRQHLGGL